MERRNFDNMTKAFKDLLEKIEATGSAALTDQERLAITEIFRRAALGDTYVSALARKIEKAHLSHCWTL